MRLEKGPVADTPRHPQRKSIGHILKDVTEKSPKKGKKRRRRLSPGGESNTRSPDRRCLTLQSGALNQLGYREKLTKIVE